MKITINAQATERKRLVQAISKWLDIPAKYCGAPTFNYEVGSITIEKTGTLAFGEGLSDDATERLLQHLYDEGFDMDMSSNETSTEAEPPQEITGVAIQIPKADFTEATLQNLFDLVEAKGNLIKKALGVTELPINTIGDRLDFPWFPANSTPDELNAYMHFVTALCEMAKNLKRVNAKEKAVDNEKYAFRCFLLRLGFIGAEYKAERKILLRNLSGSSAFKSGGPTEEVA